LATHALLCILVLAAGSACGGSTPSARSVGLGAPSASIASSSPLPNAGSARTGPSSHQSLRETLIAVVNSSRQGPSSHQEDEIELISLDGHVRARGTFQPRALPWVGAGAFPLLPRIAHTAADRAYYMDGKGTVRSIGAGDDVRIETRFPIDRAQQEGSFAVSPDGRSLVGSVFSLPPKPDPEPTPPYVPEAGYSMDVMTAAAGSAAVVRFHQEWQLDQQLGAGVQFIGWDLQAPLGTFPSSLLTRGGGSPGQWNGGTLVHFPSGQPGVAVAAPPDCTPVDVAFSSGANVCTSFVLGQRPHFEVHGADGQLLWNRACDGLTAFLSSDLQHVVVDGVGGPVVYSRDGSQVTLPPTFIQLGWLDDRTVVGQLNAATGEIGLVTLDHPDRAVGLRFRGAYVGTIGTPGA